MAVTPKPTIKIPFPKMGARDYPAVVMENVDGDSFWIYLDQGCNDIKAIVVRLFGINTAESAGKDKTASGDAAKDYMATLCPPGTGLRIRTYKGKDKYGRLLCDAWHVEPKTGNPVGDSISQKMLASGHALPYTGHGARPIPSLAPIEATPE